MLARICKTVADEAERARTALAQNLIEARRRREMSQTELAEAAGLSQQKVSAIERGRDNVTVRIVGSLAHALGVTVEALFRGSGKK